MEMRGNKSLNNVVGEELGREGEWYGKAFENTALKKTFGLVKKEIGDVFEKEEDIILQAIFYGLKSMLNFEAGMREGTGKSQIENLIQTVYSVKDDVSKEAQKIDRILSRLSLQGIVKGEQVGLDGIGVKLDNILDEFRLEKIGSGKLDRILEILNRVVAEGARMDKVLGVPRKLEEMQADLDEILRYCGRIEGIRKDSMENKKLVSEIKMDTNEEKESVKAIEEKVDLLFEMAEDLLYGENFDDVVPRDYFNEHLGKRNVFLKLSRVIEEVLEVLGKGDKKVRMPF